MSLAIDPYFVSNQNNEDIKFCTRKKTPPLKYMSKTIPIKHN